MIRSVMRLSAGEGGRVDNAVGGLVLRRVRALIMLQLTMCPFDPRYQCCGTFDYLTFASSPWDGEAGQLVEKRGDRGW